jgi:hypothetical protein
MEVYMRNKIFMAEILGILLVFGTVGMVNAQITIPDSQNLRFDQIALPSIGNGFATHEEYANGYDTHSIFLISSYALSSADRDFSTGRRVGAAFLNLLIGVGSYSMGDIFGGLITTIAEGGGIALLMYALSEVPMDFSNSMVVSMYGGVLGLIGYGVVWGIARPFYYHKPGFDMALIPGKEGIGQVQLSYTIAF